MSQWRYMTLLDVTRCNMPLQDVMPFPLHYVARRNIRYIAIHNDHNVTRRYMTSYGVVTSYGVMTSLGESCLYMTSRGVKLPMPNSLLSVSAKSQNYSFGLRSSFGTQQKDSSFTHWCELKWRSSVILEI